MRQRTWVCAIALAAVLLCAAAAVHIVRAEAFMAEVGRAAGRIASQQLGTDVQIGAVEIRSLHELAIDDIVIYDKQTEEVLRADRARVTLRLLSLLSSPATSVDEILLTGVHAHLVQREDGSWNYADLVSDDAEPSAFVGRIRIADGTADAAVAGNSYELTDLSGAVDVDRGAFSYDASAQFMGIPLRVRGEKTSDVQDVQLAADDADLTPLLALLPEGALPERVQIRALHADRVRAGLRLVDGTRTMEGRIEGVRADADLYGTQSTLTSAALRFDERALFVAATATAAEQTARVDGTVRFDTARACGALCPHGGRCGEPLYGNGLCRCPRDGDDGCSDGSRACVGRGRDGQRYRRHSRRRRCHIRGRNTLVPKSCGGDVRREYLGRGHALGGRSILCGTSEDRGPSP